MRHGRLVVMTMLAVIVVVRQSEAQTPVTTNKSPATGKNLEISVGGSFLTPTPMGSTDINLIASDGSAFRIASTKSRTAASVGLEARLGFRASPRWRVEVAGGWHRVPFQTSVSGDIENAASLTTALDVSRLTAGGAATFSVAQTGNKDVFVIAGASWMRELSELSAAGVYKDGAIVDGGFGMKTWWRERPKSKIKRMGLRLEGRLGVRTGGLALDDKSAHVLPSFVASFIIGS